MDIALRLKFTQHRDLRALLLGTGDADLVEVRGVLSFRSASGFNRLQDSPRDYFWGIGADHSGRNELGKALVRLREELREEQDNPSRIPTARRDPTRLSAQDLPSLVATQLTSNAWRLWPFRGSGPIQPQLSSPQGNGLCEV
jgi:hypothetical protein